MKENIIRLLIIFLLLPTYSFSIQNYKNKIIGTWETLVVRYHPSGNPRLNMYWKQHTIFFKNGRGVIKYFRVFSNPRAAMNTYDINGIDYINYKIEGDTLTLTWPDGISSPREIIGISSNEMYLKPIGGGVAYRYKRLR